MEQQRKCYVENLHTWMADAIFVRYNINQSVVELKSSVVVDLFEFFALLLSQLMCVVLRIH